GIHHFLVQAETQQVVAERPLEIEARRLALVVAAADAAIARMTTFRRSGLAGLGNDAACAVQRAAAERTALVHAIHRLGDEIVGEMTRIGGRPVVAAGA